MKVGEIDSVSYHHPSGPIELILYSWTVLMSTSKLCNMDPIVLLGFEISYENLLIFRFDPTDSVGWLS